MNYRRLTDSLRDALQGVLFVFRHEQNFRVQILIGFIVFALGFWLRLRAAEFIIIGLLILLVLILELLNTAVEKFLDLVKPRLHHHVEVIKDVMAAAVLLASLGSIIIGSFIFIPRVIEFLGG